MTAAEAVELVQPGDRVWVGSACGTPRELVAALNDRRLPGVKLIHFLADGVTRDGAVVYPQEVFVVGSELRGLAGPIDYLPIALPELPGLMDRGQHRVDVALIQVAPPDADGNCSLGVSVDVTLAAALRARVVLAEVNAAMPHSGPGTVLFADRIDAFVEVEPIVREYVHAPIGTAAAQIAAYVARLVPDGATLQLGLGRVPDAVLRHLSGRRDLRVHSDVITDGVVDLLDSGAVRTGPGSVLASMAVGTARLFDRLGSPEVELAPLEQVCDVRRLAQIERLVSVTQAFAVDLTGQVCTDTDDGQRYGGVGSQTVMHWTAGHSRRGRAVVCLSSQFPDGSSRIRAALRADEAATLGRADVHYIVTEFGTAYLFGRSLRERAVALIELAHPSQRADLLDAAIAAGLVPADQPLRSRGAYPGDEERTVTLKDGRPILVRPARTGDAPALQDLFYRMPPADVYTRFFRHLTTLPLSTAEHLTSVSFEEEVTFLAVVGDWGSEQVIGTVSSYLDPTSGHADVAFMVDPDWKGLGLGSALRDVLVDAARRRGVVALTADVLIDNRAMLAVFRGSGLPVAVRSSQGVSEIIVTL